MKFGTKKPREDMPFKGATPQENQSHFDAYEGEIAYLDHQLGVLFDELRKRDLLTKTLVIITSDHGEQFGEHGLFGHTNSLYRPLLHIPLVIVNPPSVPSGKRVQEAVTLSELPSTVLDLIGLEDKLGFPGTSLARHWDGTPIDSRKGTPVVSGIRKLIRRPKDLPASRGDMDSLVAGGYHYIRNQGDGREELFDFHNDPLEEYNLAETDEGQQVVEQLHQSLTSVLATKPKMVSPRFRGQVRKE
jgi:arylsulfatase A-like enzyme